MKSFSFFQHPSDNAPASALFNFGCQMSTSNPLKDKCFAATNPSPPLFPGPHKNSILLGLSSSASSFPLMNNNSVSKTSATAKPASSISCSRNHPCSVKRIRAISIAEAVSASTYFLPIFRRQSQSFGLLERPRILFSALSCDTFSVIRYVFSPDCQSLDFCAQNVRREQHTRTRLDDERREDDSDDANDEIIVVYLNER